MAVVPAERQRFSSDRHDRRFGGPQSRYFGRGQLYRLPKGDNLWAQRKNSMTLLSVLLIGFVSLAYAQQEIESLEFGSVAGQVVDQNGKPVQGVQIFALPMEKADVNGKVVFTVSRPDGKFVLDPVQSGSNLICFAKETELYPDTR